MPSGDYGLPFEPSFLAENLWFIIGGIVAAVLCLILFVIIIGAIVRAVTRTALIGMVDQIEETGAVTFKEGWRIGWSKQAWHVFLVSLFITVPLIIIFGALLLVALSPIALFFLENTTLLILGIVAMIGLMLLWILLLIVVGILVSPLQELGWRYVVLHKMGPLASLKASYALIRQNVKDVAIIVLLLIGLGMLWIVVSLVLGLIIVLLALLAGAVPGLIAGLITQTWWVGVLVGFMLFMIVIILPMTLIKGLYLIFRSAVWTLVFRELRLTDPESV